MKNEGRRKEGNGGRGHFGQSEGKDREEGLGECRERTHKRNGVDMMRVFNERQRESEGSSASDRTHKGAYNERG